MRLWPLVIALLPLTAIADEEPVLTRNHRAVSLLYLRMPVASGVMEKDHTRLDWSLTEANEMRDLPGLHEDAETTRLSLFARKGLGHGMELFAEVPVLIRGGGVMDPVIDWWHRAWGQRMELRSDTPYGLCDIQLPGSQSFGSAFGLGDVTIGVAKDLGRRTALRLAAKLPTGNAAQMLGSGGADAGLSLDRTWSLGRGFGLYAQGGLVAQSPALRVASTRGLVEQACLALTWSPNARDTWIAQWDSEGSATSTGIAASDAAHRVATFGYRRRMTDRTSLEVFFSEDGDFRWLNFPGGPDVGPDFTVGVRWCYRLSP